MPVMPAICNASPTCFRTPCNTARTATPRHWSANCTTRSSAASNPSPPRTRALYFFVFDLRRFRDLRKDDDDFGFSKSGSERPSVAKQFATILREGPALGVHTLVWCDTVSTLQRSLERQSQREFETFVLFQMSPSDSSQLIDTPAASKLGPHRALLYREDLARLEKFRPYGLPSGEWLQEIARQLAANTTTKVKVDNLNPAGISGMDG